MPKLLRRTIIPFRSDPVFGRIAGIECRGLSKLSAAYREKCYGGEELQIPIRSARPAFSPSGDGYANAQLRKMGFSGPERRVCTDCWTETSVGGFCNC